MKRLATCTLLFALLLAPTAARADSSVAAPRAVDDANVARADGERAPGYAPLSRSRVRSLVQAERLSPAPRVDLAADLRLTLPGSPAGLGSLDADFDLDRPLELRLPELPPESLRLQLPVGRYAVAYVWADLSDDVPRLDAVDGDTYFTPGVEVPLASTGLRAFVEDFQPASGIIGGTDPDEPPPARSWDGHQVAVGLRWEPVEGVVVEGASVAYVMSATRREPGVGGYVSIAIRY